MVKPKNANEFFDDSGDVTRIKDPTGGEHSHPHQRTDTGRAFLPDPYDGGKSKSNDVVAEEMGQQMISGATSGGSDDYLEHLDEASDEEEGGPFIEEDASLELRDDVDASNPPDATREPFPTAMRAGRDTGASPQKK